MLILIMIVTLLGFSSFIVVTVKSVADDLRFSTSKSIRAYADLMNNYNGMMGSIYLGVYAMDIPEMLSWNTSKNNLFSAVNQLVQAIPSEMNVNRNTSDEATRLVIQLQESIVKNVLESNYLDARRILESLEYSTVSFEFGSKLLEFIEMVRFTAREMRQQDNEHLKVYLVILSVCAVCISPIVVILVLIAASREGKSRKKLRKAKESLLMGTMTDPLMRPLFRMFVETSISGKKYFAFLEKAIKFKEQSHRVQHTDDDIMLDDIPLSPTSENSENSSQNDSVLFSREKSSLNLALEILNLFLDPKACKPENYIKTKHLEEVRNILQDASSNNYITKEKMKPLKSVFKNIEKQAMKSLLPLHVEFKKGLVLSKTPNAMLTEYRIIYNQKLKEMQRTQRLNKYLNNPMEGVSMK